MFFRIKIIEVFLKYTTLPQLEKSLKCMEEEDELMSLEQSNCDDLFTDDVSVRCSEPTDSVISEDDDDDENFEFSCLTVSEDDIVTSNFDPSELAVCSGSQLPSTATIRTSTSQSPLATGAGCSGSQLSSATVRTSTSQLPLATGAGCSGSQLPSATVRTSTSQFPLVTGAVRGRGHLPLATVASSSQLPSATVRTSTSQFPLATGAVRGRSHLPSTTAVRTSTSQLPLATGAVCSNYTKAGSWLPPATVAGCKQPHNDESFNEILTSESEEESDEEMDVQDWRRQRFIRQSYLESIKSADDDLTELMTSVQGAVKITKRVPEFTGKPMSYRAIPKEDLRNSIRLVELAEKRAEKREQLQRILSREPFFEITRLPK